MDSKPVSITHNNVTLEIQISSCISWAQFLLLVKSKKRLGINSVIETVYEVVDGKKKIIDEDFSLLKANGCYYVETEDHAPKFSNEMISFFDKLKSEQELEDYEVKIIKDVFADQKIKFKMLKKITDEKLNGYGNLKDFDGLRMAILDLIENLWKL